LINWGISLHVRDPSGGAVQKGDVIATYFDGQKLTLSKATDTSETVATALAGKVIRFTGMANQISNFRFKCRQLCFVSAQ
jgi:hypothetical protein